MDLSDITAASGHVVLTFDPSAPPLIRNERLPKRLIKVPRSNVLYELELNISVKMARTMLRSPFSRFPREFESGILNGPVFCFGVILIVALDEVLTSTLHQMKYYGERQNF